MRTIGRRYYGPTRMYTDTCAYCGVEWHRYDLRLNANGVYACPDDWGGRVEKELDYGNAEGSGDSPIIRGKTTGIP